jgi:HSP20 family protein
VRGFSRRRSAFDVFDEFFREVEERIAEIEEEFERVFRKAVEEGRGGAGCPLVYGVRITIGPDGIPRVEEFGNVVRVRRGRPLISEEMEPDVEVFERDDEVWVVADVPGVPKESIDVKVVDRTVIIKAQNGRKYYKEVELPAEVVPESAKASYRNGVLEVRFKKKEKGVKIKVE